MVHLGSGYVMKAELGMKIAAKLGINPEQNDVHNARVHINRYTQARIPNFPKLRAYVYTPFKPDDTTAYILVTRHEDDNRERKFEERPLDLGILSIVIGEFKLLAVAPYHVDFLDCFCPIPLRRSSPLSAVPLCVYVHKSDPYFSIYIVLAGAAPSPLPRPHHDRCLRPVLCPSHRPPDPPRQQALYPPQGRIGRQLMRRNSTKCFLIHPSLCAEASAQRGLTALEAARVEQAKVRATIMRKECGIKEAEKTLDGKRPDLVAIEAQITRSTCKIGNTTKTRDEVARNEEKLRDEESLEEYRKLKAAASRIFPGVSGRAVDLCKPIARKYETAMSVVLGRNIDAIVVDEEKTAIDCIEYMRNQRSGQATSIPLDTIQVKPVNDKYRAFAKGVRLAVDVIVSEGAVERAIHHACGNALVCDTMESARYVCYEKGQEVKPVTLEGTVIHKSGLITGGRSTHGMGEKWDEKNVQGLMRARDSLMAQLRELAKQKPRASHCTKSGLSMSSCAMDSNHL
ncbi:putative structural maintenance of chromosomes protein [Lyophyllum shimeji]|uniref:Structural maintenance of chromosomes protein n=1 Tax=Lyophyllum shimeji TaxID=47721 RepID=A0A9P3USF3_LYOSH|nr:putative structural maintenance of chromosomes protein [Lyophyllum shimeji]